MRFLPEGWRRLFRVWRRLPAHEVDAELGFHLDERITDLVSGGMTPEAARRRALHEFGDLGRVRAGLVAIDERMARRRTRTERWEWIGQDLRYVMRSLARAPSFVATVSLTLALGLGANAAIFSLLDRLFLRAPPGIVNPGSIRRIYRVDPPGVGARLRPGDGSSGPDVSSVFSHDDFDALRRAVPAAATLGGYTHGAARLGRGDSALSLNGAYVLADYFGVLGVQPSRGRLFQGEELRIESPTPVLVISEALWRGHFGARPDIIGLQVDLAYRPYTIVGVVPADFRGPDNDAVDVWLPMNMMGTGRAGARWYEGGHGAWIRIVARTAPAMLPALVHTATTAFRQSTFRPDSLATARLGSVVEAAMPGFDHKEVTIATRLAGVGLIILLIACANVGNLFLVRGMTRRREIAMRLALGVTRRRLVGLLLLEAVIVSMIGAGIALLVAIRGAALLREQLLPAIHWVGAPVDLRVLLFTVTLAIVTAVIAGLAPALRSSRTDLAVALKGGARDGVLQRSRIRTGFLVIQSALSVVLLAGAGLFVRSLHGIETTDIGYDTSRIIYAGIRVDPDHDDRANDASRRLPALAEQIRHLPAVDGAALAWMAPLEGISWTTLTRANGDSLPRVEADGPFVVRISPEFFRTVGIRILEGRGLAAEDAYGAGRAMVVNRTMARSYWPGRPAVGQCLIVDGPPAPCIPVVGVVSDAHTEGIVEPASMQYYLPLGDSGRRAPGVIVVRTAPGRAPQVAARIRAEFRAEFAGWAEVDVHGMSDDLVRELQPWRTGAALFSAAGLLALLVAIVGTYSTVTYLFSQRVHEMGVRIALGATAAHVARLVIGEGVRMVAVGVFTGVLLSLAAGKLVESMLYHTSSHDPAVLGAVSTTLLVVAVGACVVPAWRALRVEPAEALRAD